MDVPNLENARRDPGLTSSAVPVRRRSWPRRWRWALLVVVFAVLLGGGASAWVVARGLQTQASLERAQILVGQLQNDALGDPASVQRKVEEVRLETQEARDSSSDPLWRAAEFLPVIGANLRVVRELAAVVDDVADDVLAPLGDVAGAIDPAELRPVDGRIDLAPVMEAASVLAAAEVGLANAGDRVRRIDAAATVPQVQAAHQRLEALLGKASTLVADASRVAALAPAALGADGPRNYLMMFQNNAEARSLGGNPAALVLLTVENGAISIDRQASSGDFGRDIDLAPDLGVYSAWYPHLPAYIMEITTRPDFPTAAALAKAYWEKYIGGTVDGVVSFDPVALGYILEATGPVDLPTGDRLTSENAVALLLSDVYARYPNPRDQDAFFATAASTVFGSVTSGGLDPAAATSALQRAADEKRLLLWSTDQTEQALISTTPMSGSLPASNTETTTVGAYFMDRTVSKMSYYLRTAVGTASDLCTAEAPGFSMTVTLTSTVDPATAASLPPYVHPNNFEDGYFLTDAYLVGPVGATVEGIGQTAEIISQGTDLGRPVVGFAVLLAPGESRTVQVNFRGAGGERYGPLETATTPLVARTEVTQSTPGC